MIYKVVKSFCFCCLAGSLSLQAAARVERNVVYGMYSGLALLMDVYYPEQPNGYAVLHVTGTGWNDPLGYDAAPQSASDQVRISGQPLVDAGYTLFALNHRTGPRFRYPAPVEDIQRAVRFIRYHAERFGIRPERIGGIGGSSGGHLIAMVGVLDGKGDPDDPDPVNRQSAKLQCIVVRAAPVDLIRMTLAREFGVNTITSLMGMPLSPRDAKTTQQYQAYWKASPINYVSADDPPFLMIHGDADRTVPIVESENMQQALQSVGVAAKLIRVPGGAHGPTFPGAKSLPDIAGEMTRWLDQRLRRQ